MSPLYIVANLPQFLIYGILQSLLSKTLICFSFIIEILLFQLFFTAEIFLWSCIMETNNLFCILTTVSLYQILMLKEKLKAYEEQKAFTDENNKVMISNPQEKEIER